MLRPIESSVRLGYREDAGEAKHRAIESALALDTGLISQGSLLFLCPCYLPMPGGALCRDSAYANKLFAPWTLNPYLYSEQCE